MTFDTLRDRSIRQLCTLVLRLPRWVSVVAVAGASTALSVAALLAVALAAPDADTQAALVREGLWIAVIVPLAVATPVSALIVELVHALQREHERALEAAQRDGLTGLPTRRHTLELARRDLGLASRTGQPYSVALVDLDDFKSANDRHGHAIGDALLRAVADACRGTLRQVDVAGRWGGEEFLVLLPGADAHGAVATMERLRAAIAASEVVLGDGRRIACTASIGVATLPAGAVRAGDAAGHGPDEVIERLVATADRGMYVAKAVGKNRVEVAEPEPA